MFRWAKPSSSDWSWILRGHPKELLLINVWHGAPSLELILEAYERLEHAGYTLWFDAELEHLNEDGAISFELGLP
ncbi:hypothetical protein ACFU3E_21385 [Streptomyces sp. NPDC057424]|uniref:hypothetical protein n=1 Tax=Streptomyces sp. NPDC057424 TaxID=3346127 RepID=UPI0036AD0F0B